MPLLKRIKTETGEWGVWEIKEEESWFLDKLKLFPSEKNELKDIKGKRRIEWLAARYLVHQLSDQSIREECLKDEFGKPYLQRESAYLSMSHSHDRVAVILDQEKNVGIDIQKRVNKITRIKDKFVAEEEWSFMTKTWEELDFLHVIWGIKESLYKAFGRREINFKKHLKIKNLGPNSALASVQKDAFVSNYQAYHEIKEDYVLVYLTETNT